MNGCLLCDNGWRQVSTTYAERQVPMPDLSGLPEDLAEAERKQIEVRRAAAAGAVYPCKECQPTLFYRWAGKHLEAKHDEDECEECQEIRRGKRPKRSLAAPSPPPRKDVDL